MEDPKKAFQPPELSTRNVCWIFLHLTKLQEANLLAEMEEEDLKFFEEHSVVSSWLTSCMKRLTLNLASTIPFSSDSDRRVNICFKQLLSFTSQLETVTLELLRKSRDTEEEVEEKSREEERFPHCFTKLQVFSVDRTAVSSLMKKDRSIPQRLPFSLRELQLPRNFISLKIRVLPQSPEDFLGFYISRLPEVHPSFQITVPRAPVEHGTVYHSLSKDQEWIIARKYLVEVCQERKIKLRFVEEEDL